MTTISQALFLAVKAQLNVTHTCMPGNIIDYDHTTQKASVQPAIRKVYQTKDEQGNFLVRDMPVLNSVPVIFQRSGATAIYFPVNPGDSCLILISERSLDEWINQGGQVTPRDPRQFHLSDAVVIMGLYPFSDPLPIQNNEDFVITHAGSTITIKADGEIDIKTSSKLALGTAAVELLQQISDTLAGIAAITTTITIPSTPFGPTPFPIDNTATFTTIQSQIDSIKGVIT